jgi:hypothetical protein
MECLHLGQLGSNSIHPVFDNRGDKGDRGGSTNTFGDLVAITVVRFDRHDRESVAGVEGGVVEEGSSPVLCC